MFERGYGRSSLADRTLQFHANCTKVTIVVLAGSNGAAIVSIAKMHSNERLFQLYLNIQKSGSETVQSKWFCEYLLPRTLPNHTSYPQSANMKPKIWRKILIGYHLTLYTRHILQLFLFVLFVQCEGNIYFLKIWTVWSLCYIITSILFVSLQGQQPSCKGLKLA